MSLRKKPVHKATDFKACRPYILLVPFISFIDWYLHFTIFKTLANEEFFRKNVYFVPLVCLSFIWAWLSDSYFGKYTFSVTRILFNVACSVAVMLYSLELHTAVLIEVFTALFILRTSIDPLFFGFLMEQLELPQPSRRLYLLVLSIMWFEALASIASLYLFDNLLASHGNVLMGTAILSLLTQLALVYILIGKREKFRITRPLIHVVEKMIRCTYIGIRACIKRNVKFGDWTDSADGKVEDIIIVITERFGEVLVYSLPISVFIMAFEFLKLHTYQQGIFLADWNKVTETFRARLTDDVIHIVMIPVIHFFIFPIVRKIGIQLRVIQLMAVSQFFMFIALVSSIVLQGMIDRNRLFYPEAGFSQVRLYNPRSDSIFIRSRFFYSNSSEWVAVNSRDMYTVSRIHTKGRLSEPAEYKVDGTVHNFVLIATEKQMTVYVVNQDLGLVRLRGYESVIYTLVKTNATCYVICSMVTCISDEIHVDGDDFEITPKSPNILYEFSLTPGSHSVSLLHLGYTTESYEYSFDTSSTYSILIYRGGDGRHGMKIFRINSPVPIDSVWLIPQIFFLTIAEIIFWSTHAIFSYSQPPPQLIGLSYSLFITSNKIGILVGQFVNFRGDYVPFQGLEYGERGENV